MASMEENLNNWLGWTRQQAEKGKWYVKGEAAVMNISEKVEDDVRARALGELKELRKLCLDSQGEEGKQKAIDTIEKDMEKARKLIKKGDMTGAQKRIGMTRDKAAKALMSEDFEDPLNQLTGAVISTTFDHKGFKKVMELSSLAFKKEWRLSEKEQEELSSAIKKLNEDGSFDPPEEVSKMLELISGGVQISSWLPR